MSERKKKERKKEGQKRGLAVFKERTKEFFSVYRQKKKSSCRTVMDFYRVISPRPTGNTGAKITQTHVFTAFTVSLSLLTIKAVLFHIPAETQREGTGALISHTGHNTGVNTPEQGLPVSPPCFQPLAPTSIQLLYSHPNNNKPSGGFFFQIPSVCLSGSHSAAFFFFPRILRERKEERKKELSQGRDRGGLESLSQIVDPGLGGKEQIPQRSAEGGSSEG